jgi:hypothetical protein
MIGVNVALSMSTWRGRSAWLTPSSRHSPKSTLKPETETL